MKKNINTEGVHYLLDLWGCDLAILDDQNKLHNILIFSSNMLGTRIVGSCFHQFQPQGVTGILLLAESHLSIHTFPEYRYASVDFYLCNTDREPTDALAYIVEMLSAQRWSTKVITRGNLED